MGLWDRVAGAVRRPPKSAAADTERRAAEQVDWDAFVTAAMQEESRGKTPAPEPAPRKPLLTRLGNFLTKLVLLGIVLPVGILAAALVGLALLAQSDSTPSAHNPTPAISNPSHLPASRPAAAPRMSSQPPQPSDLAPVAGGSRTVKVRGYTRKDGTRVEGYERRK